MKIKKTKLDKKTAELLALMKRMGGNLSAERLSEIMDIPARTLRYRLAKLREGGHLGNLFTQTHEVKLGLDDSAIFMELGENYNPISVDLMAEFKGVYFMSPTYGKYNGYVIRISSPRNMPKYILKMMDALVDSKLVSKYFVFHNIDYISMAANLTDLDPQNNWKWDWNEWIQKSERQMTKGNQVKLDFDLSQELIDCDGKDLEVLTYTKENAELTHKEIGEKTNLSASQVGKRIRAFHEYGMVKGYRWLFPDSEDTLYILCYLELEEPNHPVLAYFINLPFAKEIQAETPTKLLIRMKMGPEDLVGFLHGYSKLRHHLKYSFLQTVHDYRYVNEVEEVYNLFNPKTCQWDIPIDKHIAAFKKHLNK